MNELASSPTLLIADDNAGVRRVLVQMLAAAGMRTVTADDGNQALDLARRCHPDLIILDVRMPGRDGYQVCLELRESESTRHIPILMLSGLGEFEAEFGRIGTGADDYLAKPFRSVELEARVRALLGSSAP